VKKLRCMSFSSTHYVLDLLFPRTCPVCWAPLEKNQWVCPDCLAQMNRTEQALNRENETEKYFANMRHFRYGGCWLHYKKDTYLQQLIHRAKFGQGNPMLPKQLGRECAMEWEETGFFDEVDVLVPIPLHRKRYRERGFNQSEWICKGLSEVLKIPMDTEHLTRDRATKHQSKASFEERQTGVKGAFKINHPEEWYGKTIMMVDDIITTGATMRSAIEALQDVYGCKIVVFGLAKAI